MNVHDLEFCFMPYSEMTFAKDIPLVGFCFEENPDITVERCFPELKEQRERVDVMHQKSTATTVLSYARRNEVLFPLGMVYVRFPWRKEKRWSVEDINFYRGTTAEILTAVDRLRNQQYRELIVLLPGRFHPANIRNDKDRGRLSMFVETLADAFVYANNTLDDFKSNPPPRLSRVTFTYFGRYGQKVEHFFQRAINRGREIGKVRSCVRRLIELPPNMKSPAKFVQESLGVKNLVTNDARGKVAWRPIENANHSLSSRTSVSVIYGTAALKKFGFGMHSGVGQGSAHEPCMLRVRYKPKKKRKRRIRRVGLAGKGIGFDTGGINIKDEASLENMHYDMAGAALVLGAVMLAEAIDLPVEIDALVPLAHNAVGGNALDPFSILKAYDGQTVEVVNTDAEGRLLLGDAVAFFTKSRYKYDCVVAVGTLCDCSDFAPDILKVVTTSSDLTRKVLRAESRSSEKVMLWPSLAYLNHFDDKLSGDVTDLVNDLSVGYHSVGLLFVAQFLRFPEPRFVYIDASTIFDDDAGDAGPGFGLRFLWEFLEQFK